MAHPLIPEQPIVFSPALAATIGLEEAILLQSLAQWTESQRASGERGGWFELDPVTLTGRLPFWSGDDIRRIAASLAAKGVVTIDEASARGGSLRLAFASPQAAPPAPAAQGHGEARSTSPATCEAAGEGAAPGAGPKAASIMTATWMPSDDLLELLTLSHQIPRAFSLEQLEDFRFYWRERATVSHAWESRFRQHVLSCWRRAQQDRAAAFEQALPPLDENWGPAPDAREILRRAGVPDDFIDEAIPEFVLYWRERGDAPRELNSRFVQHVRRQWVRFSASLEYATEPHRIALDWRPSADAMDVLSLCHIDADFARSLIPEFVLYWRESNQLHRAWNSKFIQHVKYSWARQHRMGHSDAGRQGTADAGRTRDRSLEQDLSDTSWAD